MKVDFVTYCCHKDIDRLKEVVDEHINSHKYEFENTCVIFQRVTPTTNLLNNDGEWSESLHLRIITDGDYDDILKRNGINPKNKEAEIFTHGTGHSHYWRHHCVNHLVALEVSEADYIVMSDADCHYVGEGDWITAAVEVLQNNPDVLVVSPSDGGTQTISQTMSQQLFLVDRKRLQSIDFDLPFEGFKDGGPMQEYYFMLEGRIGRYMEKNNLWRHILPIKYRYWHKQWH